MRRSLFIVSVAITVACGDAADCIIPPCVPPRAIELVVTASGGGANPRDVFVRDVGSPNNAYPCEGTNPARCTVIGGPRTYNLEIGAPGFRPTTVTVNVTGNEPVPCGCTTPNLVQLQVALVPGSSASGN